MFVYITLLIPGSSHLCKRTMIHDETIHYECFNFESVLYLCTRYCVTARFRFEILGWSNFVAEVLLPILSLRFYLVIRYEQLTAAADMALNNCAFLKI